MGTIPGRCSDTVQLDCTKWYDVNMPIMLILAVFAVLGLVFPKGIKFIAGTIVGFAFGGFFWAMFSIMFPALVSTLGFGCFVLLGIAIACALFFKG
jgi:hypothetical protein